MSEKFIAPPFSVIDTQKGYWSQRKDAWIRYGVTSEIGRAEGLCMAGATDLLKKSSSPNTRLNGTSVFDPCLCEVVYSWFNVKNGIIFDPFAGGCVRGVVADKLGYKYIGIELRQEQVDANIQTAQQLGLSPIWICDDSLNADKYIEDNSADLLFTCPPYADLEVYSDDPRDISNMDWDGFCDTYKRIIEIACRKVKNDRFAVVVVGDVRDRNGLYRNLIDYTKACFNEQGFATYNEIILRESGALAPQRANGQMKSRKVVKIHQNVLVFFKGDPSRIWDIYGDVDVLDILEENLE